LPASSKTSPPPRSQDLAALASDYVERSANDREKLERMVGYGQTALCRWRTLLDYFGEAVALQSCGTCDNCQGNAVRATGSAL
jgi:ATP-dependent DNA helicase RecQ